MKRWKYSRAGLVKEIAAPEHRSIGLRRRLRDIFILANCEAAGQSICTVERVPLVRFAGPHGDSYDRSRKCFDVRRVG